MNKKSLTRNKKLIKQSKRILSGEEPLKLTDAKGIAKQAFNSDNIGSTISGIASGIGTIVEASMANAKVDTSTADNAIQAVNNFQPSTSTLNALSEDMNTLKYADTSYNSKDFTVSTGEGIANMGKAGLTGFTTGLETGGIFGGIAGGLAGLIAAGSTWGASSKEAEREADRLSREAKVNNLSADLKAENALTTILENKNEDYMINHAAYGGPLHNHSGDWSNGLTFINEGGTHEENPMEGVLMGFDQEGVPNLVEEGEVIYNDYVFSNRLKPSKRQLENAGLNKKYIGWTFAKIVEDLQKHSAETPLDKISQDSLNDMMNTMMILQEEVRNKKGLIGENRLMKFGGKKCRKYSGDEVLDPVIVVDKYKDLPLISSPLNLNKTIVGNELLNQKAYARMHPTFNQASAIIDNSATNRIVDEVLNKPVDYSSLFSKPSTYAAPKFIEVVEEPVKEKRLPRQSKGTNVIDTLGMLTPTIDSFGKLISNLAKPVDKSNFIAEKANRQRPKANLGRINVQPKLELIDENAFVAPIINQGRATARDIQNLGTTGADVMNRLALNAYNTQNAIGKGLIDASTQNWSRQQQYDSMLANLQRANSSIDQSEFALNDAIGKDIALGKIQDALAIENAENARLQAIDSLSADMAQSAADLSRQNIEWNWIKNNPQYAEAVTALRGKRAANGGMLTRKKRRR